MVRIEPADGGRLFSVGILNILGLIQAQGAPFHLSKTLLIQLSQRVGSKHHIRSFNGRGEGFPFGALSTVMQMYPQLWGETLQLLLPIPDNRSGADKQGGSLQSAAFLQMKEVNDPLDGFAQTHIIRQTSSQAIPAEESHPRHTLPLITPELTLKTRRIRQKRNGRGLLQLSQHLAQVLVQLHFQPQQTFIGSAVIRTRFFGLPAGADILPTQKMKLHGFPEGQPSLFAGAAHHLADGIQHGRIQ
ncbi:hypothetical protein D3C75_726190 [compost metagenome]